MQKNSTTVCLAWKSKDVKCGDYLNARERRPYLVNSLTNAEVRANISPVLECDECDEM
jgi:hypothetical protein